MGIFLFRLVILISHSIWPISFTWCFLAKRGWQNCAKTSHLGVLLHFSNNSNNLPLLYYHWCLGLHWDYAVRFSCHPFFVYIVCVCVFVCWSIFFTGEGKQFQSIVYRFRYGLFIQRFTLYFSPEIMGIRAWLGSQSQVWYVTPERSKLGITMSM